MKKRNYIWNCVDTKEFIGIKPLPLNNKTSKWKDKLANIDSKFRRKLNKNKRRQRKYKRIPTQYKVYIKSKWWTRRKNQYYQLNVKQCQACLSNKYINLHHMLYVDYGRELDENLVALCKGCHEEYHLKYGVKRNMINDTNKFIIEKRELMEFPLWN